MIHPTMFQQLKNSLRAGTPHNEYYKTAIENIAGVGVKFDQERQRINADVSLSTEGKRQALARVAKTMARDLAEAARPMRKGFESVQATRASFKPEAISRNDVAAELKRAEIRAFLSELSGPKRVAAAIDLAKSREGQLAIIDAHPLLTGLPKQIHAEIRDQHLAELHGPAMREADALDGELKTIGAAFGLVRSELHAASLMTDDQFEEHLAPMQKRIDSGPLSPEIALSADAPLFTFDAKAFDAEFDRIVAEARQEMH